MARARKQDDNTEGDASASQAIEAAHASSSAIAGGSSKANPGTANLKANGSAAEGKDAFGKQAGGDIIVVAA
jgi:hypothetical protein